MVFILVLYFGHPVTPAKNEKSKNELNLIYCGLVKPRSDLKKIPENVLARQKKCKAYVACSIIILYYYRTAAWSMHGQLRTRVQVYSLLSKGIIFKPIGGIRGDTTIL